MKNTNIYSYLAETLSYPQSEYAITVAKCADTLKADFPEIRPYFTEMLQFASTSDAARLEEAYTSTFDINAVCHLDVGYQLFGEDYKRGALLVELSRVQREAGVPVGTELADHLPVLLRLLPKMNDSEERTELARRLLLPAIEKMIASFPETSSNVYRSSLRVTASVLETDFGPRIEFPVQPDYSAQIEEVMHV
ncbi:MAG: hypothetical protein H6617_05795 [Bdellovibrionaceae bacterium]|nr:hypothetical protein [Bdellovibrionales bacterium]MCB9254178.1 hypothetical protein [Pseudobdellovibrionaceae bacterium]